MATEPHSPAQRSRDAASFLARIAAIGAAAQASVPGFYAWAVTVAPVAWSRGASFAAKVAALAGVVALVGGIALEQRAPEELRRTRARYVSVWGLTLSSAIVWVLTPQALAPLRFEAPRGIAGFVGWALFAFVSAAPALSRARTDYAPSVDAPQLAPRTNIRRGDVVYIVAGAAAALFLQTIGWRTPTPERALLVRLVTVLAGVALVGAATSISLARHERHGRRAVSTRFWRATGWLALLAVLAIGGATLALR